MRCWDKTDTLHMSLSVEPACLKRCAAPPTGRNNILQRFVFPKMAWVTLTWHVVNNAHRKQYRSRIIMEWSAKCVFIFLVLFRLMKEIPCSHKCGFGFRLSAVSKGQLTARSLIAPPSRFCGVSKVPRFENHPFVPSMMDVLLVCVRDKRGGCVSSEKAAGASRLSGRPERWIGIRILLKGGL